MVVNWFHKQWEAREYRVAEKLLSGKTVSFDDLSLAAGGKKSMAKNTLGMVIAMIEDQNGVIVKKRTYDHGIVYRFVADAEYEPERALTDPASKRLAQSNMARLWRGKIITSGQPRRF